MAGRAQRQCQVLLPRLTDAAQTTFAVRRADQRDAPRQLAWSKSRRHRQRRPTEQIHKIRVMAQAPTPLRRVRLHLAQQRDGRHGWHHKHVRVGEINLAIAPQLPQRRHRLERIDRRKTGASLDDGPCHRVEVRPMRAEERLQPRQTLREKRPLIQQAGNLAQGLKIQLHGPATHFFERLNRGRERLQPGPYRRRTRG